uniref:Uncharacterized protein n=1 Tax=Panagrolaimus davidi TaxID=227884 RepID=A0A914PMM9_9BILA
MKIVVYKQIFLADDAFEFFVQNDVRLKVNLIHNFVEFTHPVLGKLHYALASISVGRVGDYLMINHAGLDEFVVFRPATHAANLLYQRLSSHAAVCLLDMTEFPNAQLMEAACSKFG